MNIPIIDYCDQNTLSVEERLNLFIQVCKIVQCAHQNGFVHVGIEPSNILVADRDDKRAEKTIIIASIDKSKFIPENQLIGTSETINSKQIERIDKDIGIQRDIHLLGVLLYGLLVGVDPLELQTPREANFMEIREEEFPRPSEKLCSFRENALKVAQNSHTELPVLQKSLREELDWITLMAIGKDKGLRYKTVSDLVKDVQKYLHNAPSTARKKFKVHQIKQYIRNNPVFVATVAFILLILVIEMIILTSFAVTMEIAKEVGICIHPMILFGKIPNSQQDFFIRTYLFSDKAREDLVLL